VVLRVLVVIFALWGTFAVAAPALAAEGDRCALDRLLVAGSETVSSPTGLWWVWPDEGLVQQVEGSEDQRSYLVAVSPDQRWVTYYQRSPLATDRFVVDTWVMDLATDERFKLVEGNAPIAWRADSTAVVLGERPYLMATVPDGALVATAGELVSADAMRSVLSPDGRFRASVATTPNGAAGVNITDAGAQEPIMTIPTGRGAVQLAWSPDSSRLAFTSGTDGPDGLVWRLNMVDLADQRVSLVESTAGMELHSVVWAPPLPGC
jgi:Tol biopolymer transport system component